MAAAVEKQRLKDIEKLNVVEDPTIAGMETAEDSSFLDGMSDMFSMGSEGSAPIIAPTTITQSSNVANNTSITHSNISWTAAFMDTMRGPLYQR